MTLDVTIRRASNGDARALAHFRIRMNAELAPQAEIPVDYLARCEAFFERELPGTTYRSWLAFDGDTAIGAASLHLFETFPRMFAVRALDGRVRNVYVDPAYRGRGIAMRLLREAIAEAKREQVDRLTLRASPQGRAIYERLGFIACADEMIYQPGGGAESCA